MEISIGSTPSLSVDTDLPDSLNVGVSNIGNGNVFSVNGQTGTVVLDYEDVGALSDDTTIPSKTSELTNDSGFLTSHQSLDAYRTSAAQDVIDNTKQATLISGTNIKTINNNSLLGSGNINLDIDSVVYVDDTVTYAQLLEYYEAGKCIILVHGILLYTLQTVNITQTAGNNYFSFSSCYNNYVYIYKINQVGAAYTNVVVLQDYLVSGTNIKTINNYSILGSGNIDIQGTTGDYIIVTDSEPSQETVQNIWNAYVSGKPVYKYSSATANMKVWLKLTGCNTNKSGSLSIDTIFYFATIAGSPITGYEQSYPGGFMDTLKYYVDYTTWAFRGTTIKGTFAPIPPSSGTYKLQSVDGIMSWVAES